MEWGGDRSQKWNPANSEAAGSAAKDIVNVKIICHAGAAAFVIQQAKGLFLSMRGVIMVDRLQLEGNAERELGHVR